MSEKMKNREQSIDLASDVTLERDGVLYSWSGSLTRQELAEYAYHEGFKRGFNKGVYEASEGKQSEVDRLKERIKTLESNMEIFKKLLKLFE